MQSVEILKLQKVSAIGNGLCAYNSFALAIVDAIAEGYEFHTDDNEYLQEFYNLLSKDKKKPKITDFASLKDFIFNNGLNTIQKRLAPHLKQVALLVAKKRYEKTNNPDTKVEDDLLFSTFLTAFDQYVQLQLKKRKKVDDQLFIDNPVIRKFFEDTYEKIKKENPEISPAEFDAKITGYARKAWFGLNGAEPLYQQYYASLQQSSGVDAWGNETEVSDLARSVFSFSLYIGTPSMGKYSPALSKMIHLENNEKMKLAAKRLKARGLGDFHGHKEEYFHLTCSVHELKKQIDKLPLADVLLAYLRRQGVRETGKLGFETEFPNFEQLQGIKSGITEQEFEKLKQALIKQKIIKENGGSLVFCSELDIFSKPGQKSHSLEDVIGFVFTDETVKRNFLSCAGKVQKAKPFTSRIKHNGCNHWDYLAIAGSFICNLINKVVVPYYQNIVKIKATKVILEREKLVRPNQQETSDEYFNKAAENVSELLGSKNAKIDRLKAEDYQGKEKERLRKDALLAMELQLNEIEKSNLSPKKIPIRG